MLSKSPRHSVLMESNSQLGLSSLHQHNAHTNYSFCELFLIMLTSRDLDQWTLRTQCLARNYFLYIQHTMNLLKLQTPTVPNVNSDCLYSELLRVPSIIGPWEDRILPQLERVRERKKRAKMRKGKRDSRGESAQRN